jgi:hypothetical protein
MGLQDLFGGGGGDSDSQKLAEQMAQKMFQETDPFRQGMYNNWNTLMGQGDGMAWDVSANPVWAPAKSTIEEQYQNANRNIIANMPTGGGMTSAMTDLESGRAQSLGELTSTIAMDDYNKMYGSAFGAPQTSTSAMTTLAGQEAMANAQEQAGKFGAMGGIGQGLGMYFGSK